MLHAFRPNFNMSDTISIWSNCELMFLHQSSCHWLFLLVGPQCMETATCNLNLIVFINETHTTVPWNVGGDSLVILLELNSDTLSDTGVRLFTFDTNLFNNDTG